MSKKLVTVVAYRYEPPYMVGDQYKRPVVEAEGDAYEWLQRHPHGQVEVWENYSSRKRRLLWAACELQKS